MVILAVLVTLIFAMTLAAKMTDLGLDAQRVVDQATAREENYLVARSAVEMGFELLRSDTNETDNLNDAWALGELDFEWEGKPVHIRIVDEESKFPLGALQEEPDNTKVLAESLQRFLDNAGLPNAEEAVSQFLDWVDTDSNKRPSGAEIGDYEDGLIKDAPMDSLYELDRLRAWTEKPKLPSPRRKVDIAALGMPSIKKNYNDNDVPVNDGEYELEVPGAETMGGTGTSEWEDWMTVTSSGKINVNTAPKKVLLCLDDAMTDVIVNEIDDRRRSEPFKKIEDLREVAGMNADLVFRIKGILSCTSSVFTVEASVSSYPAPVTVRAVVTRGTGAMRVIRWEAN